MIELNRILCAVDFSEVSERALTYAARMAKWYGASLHVLHVMPPMPPSTTNELAASSRALTARNLRSLVERYSAENVDIGSELIESADTARKILEGAERYRADVIVTGSHGRTGVQRVLLGSVVEALLHTSGCPIVTVPSHADPRRLGGAASMSRIVCALDFGSASLAAAEFALMLAEEANARLTLLHVIDLPPELQRDAQAHSRRQLLALVPEHARDYCTVDAMVLEGAASREILRLAAVQDADLIVLGVHGRNAFDLAFFGSNSKDVIRNAQCPVLIVPASRRAKTHAA